VIVPSSTGMAFGLASAIVVGIDATRNRSGGAVAHLRGILAAIDPVPCGISQVHLWSYDELLQTIKSQPWLIKHPVAAQPRIHPTAACLAVFSSTRYCQTIRSRSYV
jgi:hypothetical protein